MTARPSNIRHHTFALAALFAMVICAQALATETENHNIRILPPPGKIVIDGKSDDWDLSGGVFVCSDVENLRDKLGLWVHAAYDTEQLYILARFRDETPLSNPGLAGADHPWKGDSLQVRVVADPERRVKNKRGKPVPVMCWINGWRDRAGTGAIDIAFPGGGGKNLKDALAKGARIAFTVNDDGKGYVQEMALPWSLLIDGGIKPEPGQRILTTVEPNFNMSSGARITMKGIFRPGVIADRVFTFRGYKCWGEGIFMDAGKVQPQRLRLADNREFAVSTQDGVPVVDWTGLFQARQMEGFVKIPLEVPEDGYVSLNIKNTEGQVVRQLLTADFYTKGDHEVEWDGLTNMSHLKAGKVVKPGDYTWEAIHHTGIGLRLVGWADNSGKTPFNAPGGDWGGDHGIPIAVTTDGKQMYLGWSGSEAGRALVCTDLQGKVKWRHKHGGMGNARLVAVTDGVVFVYNRQRTEQVIYRLDAAKGEYRPWADRSETTLSVSALLQPFVPPATEEGQDAQPNAPLLTGMDAIPGRLFLSYGAGNRVLVLSAATGTIERQIEVAAPGDVHAAADGNLYVLSAGSRLLRLDPEGTEHTVIDRIENAKALAVDAAGAIYVGVGDPDNQVKVFDADGKLLRSIGKPGGRPLLGLWKSDGMRFVSDLRVDANGVLWVAEADKRPKRFSCWNTTDGTFVREFFGPTGYGALGGAISPDDPLTMVGSGCEWRLDPTTGKSSIVSVFHRGLMNTARFGRSPDGRLFVAVGEGWIHGQPPVSIYERLADGQYKLRTRITSIESDTGKRSRRGKPIMKPSGIRVWADANDDQQEQPGEVSEYAKDLGGWITGWYLPFNMDMSFYGTWYQLAPTGWTPCGAPQYDVSQARALPKPDNLSRGAQAAAGRGLGTEDGRLMLYNGLYAEPHTSFPCYDIETGRLLWDYPNNYVGVHGGHRAPPPQVGMIRAAYGIIGTGKLPEPIGDIFVIGTDKGEWHILTGQGYYLTKLFESDPFKRAFPDPCVPGAILDNVPPGGGAEDFGGSITVGQDGYLYVQAGQTAYINMKVVGLESVRSLLGGSLVVKESDLPLAAALREKLVQASVATRRVTAKPHTVNFTGDLRADFNLKEPQAFQKTPADRVEVAIAYDDTNLYLGWTVKDATPWVNGASDPLQMYAMGDTVDFQLGTDPRADPKREKPVLGDLRLSIGNLRGTPTAVIYRPVAKEKAPRKFFSGVVQDGYEMQSVTVLDQVRIKVKVDGIGKQYTVQAAIPLAVLGLTPTTGMTLSCDFGATFGDAEGKDTVLRSHWNNRETGLVADEVFELQLQPGNWGKIAIE